EYVGDDRGRRSLLGEKLRQAAGLLTDEERRDVFLPPALDVVEGGVQLAGVARGRTKVGEPAERNRAGGRALRVTFLPAEGQPGTAARLAFRRGSIPVGCAKADREISSVDEPEAKLLHMLVQLAH